MTVRKAASRVTTTTKKNVTPAKKAVRSAASGKFVSPASARTADINYYGTKSQARNAAYSRVMAFVEQSKPKHVCG